MDFYDSTRPELIPDGKYACLYYDGDYAAHPDAVLRLGPVRWITVTGDFRTCGAADYERGNEVFSKPGALRAWVAGRTQQLGKRARVYCDRDNLTEVRAKLTGLDWELWLATLDGNVLLPSYAPNLWAVQYAGGPDADYDTSVLYGAW